MAQRLILHEKWSKALSPEGKAEILHTFLSRNEFKDDGVVYYPFKLARNYRGDLLLTVLIENYTEKNWYLHSRIQCTDDNGLIAEHDFNEPGCEVAARTSMPWTLIFSEKDVLRVLDLDDLTLNDLKVSDRDGSNVKK